MLFLFPIPYYCLRVNPVYRGGTADGFFYRYTFFGLSSKYPGVFLPLISGIARCENRVSPIALWISKPYYNSNKTGRVALIKIQCERRWYHEYVINSSC